ncbi:hypothetical protein GLOTRDRAFT_131861 [Gloeophyllum trabeum ATCC 11539]|uniref:Uncharacterized protein n=1 Tax=Gloeophyllum trabeum (strain ATCC 11539 / FP-39264 / Madison 617) TaxID=670483 RepID=S7PYA8_GLOTA|nr:uncharacterized protein GLOTRDRAFT_131861 [Gloeophyllum trabeum ATCC 11539]EPQ52626.1 hypothetical protein GLOTRDRAFT_131861 [Gloeophyllum trabeum ATCC 11539]
MHPFAILSSVCSAATSIFTCLDGSQQADVTVDAVHDNVRFIQEIIHPLATRRSLPPGLVLCLLDIGDNLCSIHQGLTALKGGQVSVATIHAFFFPSRVISKLKRDSDLLLQRALLLKTACQAEHTDAPPPQADIGILGSVGNPNVRQSWSDVFGNEDAYAARARFRLALDSLFNLSEEDFHTLWLRLDEFRINVVTPATLERFGGQSFLTDAVQRIRSGEAPPASSNHVYKCLLWVDDKPENKIEEVMFALQHHIQVQRFTSTAVLKDWLEQHPEMQDLDRSSSLRIIIDNSKPESGGANGIFTFSAGENIVRYMRGRQYQAPILVYCGSSIQGTGYVLSYANTGSTTEQSICRAFISGLLAPGSDERVWQAYNATPMSIPTLQLNTRSPLLLQTRLARFGDTDSTSSFFTVGNGGGSLRSFYNGKEVDMRMSHIREAIHHVRGNWHLYADFLSRLRDLLLQLGEHETVSPILDTLPRFKQWSDRRRGGDPPEDYGLLRLYTTPVGYLHAFKIINEVFRTHDIDNERLVSAVFFVELLNIELFKYITEQGMRDVGFTGTVHRGLCLSTVQLDAFYQLARMPIRERFWSIPLAIVSCSMDEDIAVKFALQQATAHGTEHMHPVLWRIHVANLDPELLRVYHQYYPMSVVTTMCAVPDSHGSWEEGSVGKKWSLHHTTRSRRENLM